MPEIDFASKWETEMRANMQKQKEITALKTKLARVAGAVEAAYNHAEKHPSNNSVGINTIHTIRALLQETV